jgi:hypothetical protein
MLSVLKLTKVIFIILIFTAPGCLSSEKVKDDRRDLEALIDSARSKVSLGGQYLINGEDRKAREILIEAIEDLDRSLLIGNKTLKEEERDNIMNASDNIETALDMIILREVDTVHSFLELSEEELLRVGISIQGVNERPEPERFSVTNAEMPITYYGSVDGIYLGYKVVPHNVAKAAREAFYAYEKTKDSEDLNRGIFLTEYLISTSSERDNGTFIVWENNFIWPVYNLSKGWIGSLSQAGCLKALMLAYEITNDEKYLKYSKKALKAFDVDIANGGLRASREDDSGKYTWYPEYVKPDPPYVLNGFITTVVWIGEYHEITRNPDAKRLFVEGLESIKHYLPTYENRESWSFYDAHGHEANRHYHELHVKLMEMLYEETGEEIFMDYQELWAGGMSEAK